MSTLFNYVLALVMGLLGNNLDGNAIQVSQTTNYECCQTDLEMQCDTLKLENCILKISA